MQLTGLSRPESGRFSSTTDYLVEARLRAPGRLQIRLLSGRLVRLAGRRRRQRQPTAQLLGRILADGWSAHAHRLGADSLRIVTTVVQTLCTAPSSAEWGRGGLLSRL